MTKPKRKPVDRAEHEKRVRQRRHERRELVDRYAGRRPVFPEPESERYKP